TSTDVSQLATAWLCTAVHSDPACALPSAVLASLMYPRYNGAPTAARIPTIRITISSSIRVNPRSCPRPNSLRIARIQPSFDGYEITSHLADRGSDPSYQQAVCPGPNVIDIGNMKGKRASGVHRI